MCVNYDQSGSLGDSNYEETAYYDITLEDGTVLYAICHETKTEDRVELVSFNLFSECPW